MFVMSITSCTDWLDVNTDPDNPNNKSALVANRLPWIQHFYMYSAGVTNYRTSLQAGVYYTSNGVSNNGLNVTWACLPGSTTTSYQSWFAECANNLNDTYEKAEAEGAYHYMAAVDVIHALGFMEMLDLYGEIPYTDALGESVSPTYDDGKTVFNGCIAKLDEAIKLFEKTQETGAEQFADGDMWHSGDVSKWIKLCYGLKARYLLKLSKKADTFDMDEILDCLAKGPESNADNTIGTCYNKTSDVTDSFYGDPIMTNGNWDYAAYGSTQRISKYYYDLLTDMRSSGITDPRMSKIVPASMCNIKLDASGKVQSYDWLRSKPVDFYGESARLVYGGATSILAPTYASSEVQKSYAIDNDANRSTFIAAIDGKYAYTVNDKTVKVTYRKGAIYVNSDDYMKAGDSIYISLRNNSVLTGNSSLGEMDMNWYFQSAAAMSAGAVGSTGSFQIRPNSDQEILTYHEMCFIKAEIYMRKGDKNNALKAYKDGIKAHIDMMQDKLTEWKEGGYKNPDMWPMDESEISNYLTSDAVCQTSSELTMADIMLQKYAAMGCSIENWNDMRRFNYSAGNIGSFGVVYPGYDRSPLFAGQAQITGTTKTDPKYWMRRWRMPDKLELAYNSTNAIAANAHAMDADIWCIPVWWDCSTDEEYYGYIK